MRLTHMRHLCGVFVIAAILCTGVLLYTLYATVNSLRASDDHRMAALNLIDELRNSSRQLTQSARNVVVTVNPGAEKLYHTILNERDGTTPRHKTARFAPNRQVDFLTLLGELDLSEVEYTPIRLAYEASQALTRVEIEAIRLSRDVQIDALTTDEERARAQDAVRKVFGPAYTQSIDVIQGYLNNATSNLLSRINAAESSLKQRLILLFVSLCVTIFVLVVSIVYMGQLRSATGTAVRGNLILYFYVLLALVLALGVPMWLFYTDARTILVSAVEKRQALIGREVYRELHMRATQSLEIAQILASRTPLRKYVLQENAGQRLDPTSRAEALDVLESFVERYTDTAQCILLARDGATLGSTAPDTVQRKQQLFPPQEIARVIRGESFITTVTIPGNVTPELAALTPIYAGDNNTGTAIGILVSLLDKRNSFRLWEDRLATEEQMNIFVMNENAVVVLSSRGQERQGLKMQDDPVGKLVREGVEGLRYYTDAYGVDRIGYFWRLPQLGWTIGVTSVYASLTDGVRDMLVRATLFGMMAILVAVAIFTQLMRRMTQNLQNANEQITSLMEQGGIHTWEMDITGNVVHLDAQWFKNSGFPPPWEDSIWPIAKLMAQLHPEDRPLMSHQLTLMGSNKYANFELRICSPQGTYHWHRNIGRVTVVDDKGQAVRYSGMGYDVTAPKRVEASEAALQNMTETLRDTNERLTNLMDGAGIHMWSFDTVADTYTFSSQWLKNTGFPPPWEDGVWTTREVLERVHPEDVDRVTGELTQLGVGDYISFDIRIRSYSGDYVWLRNITRADAVDENGVTTCVSAMGFDITAQKKAEQTEAEYKQVLEGIVLQRTKELEESRNQAEAASQAKTAFLSTVSHEIRTPMNAIVGFAHILDRSNLTPLQKEQLDKITLSAGALLAIINDVLDISKIEAGKLDLESLPFDMHVMLDTVLSITGFAATEKGLALKLHIADDVPRSVIGDAKRISQILLNLLNNALKFTPMGQVSLEVNIGKPRNPAEKAPLFTLRVRDTGIGMSAEQLARIFQPFMQADSSVTRRFGGTGLGLAISKHLVELMGGSIGVDSQQNKGSVFYFSLPLTLSDEATVRANNTQFSGQGTDMGDDGTAVSPVSFDGVRVLVVEDNEINQEIARALLEEHGLAVDMAYDGANALGTVLEHRYECIFMDMQMPVMGGIEATKRLRALGKDSQASNGILAWLADVPIIAMTANAMAEDRQRCLAAGMNDHIGKPIDPGILRDCLMRWLAPRIAPT